MKGGNLSKLGNKVILEVKNICKNFGAVVALNNVCFKLHENEILGIVGDNGAGKSTLIKIIAGVFKKDSGEIYFYGKKVNINNPNDSKILGIETVYQDLALVDTLDIPGNIFLGREETYFSKYGVFLGLLNNKKMYIESLKVIGKLKVDIQNLLSKVNNLSGGQRQAIALSKAVYWGKKVVILDEPTAALGVKESINALKLIKLLKKHKISVIVISHNLQHMFSIVDRIMVLRRGVKVGVVNANETNSGNIVSMITGVKVMEKV